MADIKLTPKEEEEGRRILKDEGEPALREYYKKIFLEKMQKKPTSDEILANTQTQVLTEVSKEEPETQLGIVKELPKVPSKELSPKEQKEIKEKTEAKLKSKELDDEKPEPLTREEVQQILSQHGGKSNGGIMALLIPIVMGAVAAFLMIQLFVMPSLSNMVSKKDFTTNLQSVAADIKTIKDNLSHLEQVDRNLQTQDNQFSTSVSTIQQKIATIEQTIKTLQGSK